MNRMKGVLRSFLFLIACPVVLIITTSFVKTTSFAATIEAGAISCVVTYGLTLLFLRWDGWHLRDAGLALTPKSPLRMFSGLLIGLALVAFQETSLYATGHIRWAYTGSASSIGLLAPAILAYLLLALREEIAFRAYPLRHLERDLGAWASLLIVGLVFAVEHVAGGFSWVNSLLGPLAGAILFGMAALATRGIAVPLGIHFAFNLGQWIMGQKETAGLWRVSVDPAFQKQTETIGYAAYLLGALAATFGFWLHYHRRVAPFVSHQDTDTPFPA